MGTSINNLEARHTIALRTVLSNILSISYRRDICRDSRRPTQPLLLAMKPRSSYSKNRTVDFIRNTKAGIPSQLQHYPFRVSDPAPDPVPNPSQQYPSMTLMKPSINIPRELQTLLGLNPDSSVEPSYLTVERVTQMYVYFPVYHTKAH